MVCPDPGLVEQWLASVYTTELPSEVGCPVILNWWGLYGRPHGCSHRTVRAPLFVTTVHVGRWVGSDPGAECKGVQGGAVAGSNASSQAARDAQPRRQPETCDSVNWQCFIGRLAGGQEPLEANRAIGPGLPTS